MSILSNKKNVLLTTVLFILVFIGYELVTTLFLGNESITKNVTIPYRAGVLLLSMLVTIINFNSARRIDNIVKLLFFFFFLYFVRIVYELFFDIDSSLDINFYSVVINYVFLIITPTAVAIYFGYNKIDLNKAIDWIYYGFVVCSVVIFFNNNLIIGEEMSSRVDANIALDTIGYGQLCVSTALLSIFFFLKCDKLLLKTVHIAVFLIAVLSLIIGGSRGPIVSLLVVCLFWMCSRVKRLFLGLLLILLIVFLIYLFSDPILSFIGDISPLTQNRIMESLYNKDLSGREIFYNNALDIFLKNPIIGNQLVTDYGIYSHNLFLDVLMGVGIIGFIPFIIIFFNVIIKSYKLIQINSDHYWICLLLLQQLTFLMSSSALYINQLTIVLLLFLFLRYKSLIHIKK